VFGVCITQQSSHDGQAASSTGPTPLQRNIRCVEAANSKIIPERIREEWTETDNLTICIEVEFEKHLWMLTALKYLGKRSLNKPEDIGHREEEIALTTEASSVLSKVLSLFENRSISGRL